MENIFSQEDDDGKKCLRRHVCFKEMFEEDNFSPAPPPPTLPQKNNGPSLSGDPLIQSLR